MKALFRWKLGPLPQFGDGEVELGSEGLEVRLPSELARKLKKGYGLGTLAKESVLIGLLGPGGLAFAKGKKTVIPYSVIYDARLTQFRYGVFGKKDFIEITFGDERKGTAQLWFAPFEGTLKRKFKSHEFFEMLKARLGSSRVSAPIEEEETAVTEVRRRRTRTRSTTKRKKQPRFCPNCGSPVEPTDRFCAYCGHRLK